MFRLRKVYPPFGTEITPLWEHAYSEQVKVVNGLCEVREPATRDYLLNLGYEMVAEIVPLSEQPVVSRRPDRKPDKPKTKQRRERS